MIRLLVAEDQAMIRGLLVALLSHEEDIEVVGECADGNQAVDSAKRLKPDVVLMDIRMPEMDGIEATSRIIQLPPATPFELVALRPRNLCKLSRSGGCGRVAEFGKRPYKPASCGGRLESLRAPPRGGTDRPALRALRRFRAGPRG